MTEARTRLTEEQAREVHSLVVQGWVFAVFASMAAHVLVWLWRPLVYTGQMVPPDWRFF
jgi:hypothetical protein